MKLLKLFLLLSIGLWAGIVPNGIKGEQLISILDNGWNENNQTLNQLIIDNGQKKLHEILTGLDEPFSKKGKSFRETPNFLLTRDDYYFIFSYVKYLEYQGKIDQAIKVYTRALKGLSNIKNNSVIGYIYHLVMEKITVESINQMIKTKKVNTKQLINIKEELQSTLFLNNTVFLDTVINELGNDEISLTQDGLLNIKNKKERIMFKEMIGIYIELSKKYYYKLWAIKSSEEKEFKDTFEKEKNIFFENNEREIEVYYLLTWGWGGFSVNNDSLKNEQDEYMQEIIKFWKEKDEYVKKTIREKGLNRENDLNIQIAGKTLFYTATLSPEHFFEMKKDIDEEIKRNRALLKSLER